MHDEQDYRARLTAAEQRIVLGRVVPCTNVKRGVHGNEGTVHNHRNVVLRKLVTGHKDTAAVHSGRGTEHCDRNVVLQAWSLTETEHNLQYEVARWQGNGK